MNLNILAFLEHDHRAAGLRRALRSRSAAAYPAIFSAYPRYAKQFTSMRLLMVNLTTDDISDSAGAQAILDAMRKRWPTIKHLFADGAYDLHSGGNVPNANVGAFIRAMACPLPSLASAAERRFAGFLLAVNGKMAAVDKMPTAAKVYLGGDDLSP